MCRLNTVSKSIDRNEAFLTLTADSVCSVWSLTQEVICRLAWPWPLGKASGSNILLHHVCFTKPSSPHSDSSWARAQFFCDAFKRGNKLKGRWGETMSAWPLGPLLQKKRPRGSGRSRVWLFLCLLCFVLFWYTCLCFWSFPFFCSRIILHTAVCSEGSDLLAETPELTSDMCCEDLTQMTTW